MISDMKLYIDFYYFFHLVQYLFTFSKILIVIFFVYWLRLVLLIVCTTTSEEFAMAFGLVDVSYNLI